MKPLAAVALVCLLLPKQLPAQTVIRPAAPLDSARAVLRDALDSFRDSLLTVNGAAARLQRDNRTASDAALVARARFMREACERSLRALPPTREAVLAAALSDKKKVVRQKKDLVVRLDSLKLALRRCEADFAEMSQPDQGERVRGYGNDRADRVQRAMQQYEASLRAFLQIMRIDLSPIGPPRPPTVG